VSEQHVRHDEIDLLTLEEVAELFRVQTRTVERMVKDGRLPVVKLGPGKSAVRFHRRDVTHFVRVNTRRALPNDEGADA
jgi:excisionase family DNA binding protein